MRFKKLLLTGLLFLLCSGCAARPATGGIAATTAPVAQFTGAIADGTGLTVTQVISDSVSCLHDYSLSVRQMELLSESELVLLSGAGLEDFMEDALAAADTVVDCSAGISLLEADGHDHETDGHDHEHDPHIWLSPENAKVMAQNIFDALSAQYPDWEDTFRANLTALLARLEQLDQYGKTQLADLRCRELVTFHDGFAYLARSFDLEIAAAIEEESGAEASAADLIGIIDLLDTHGIPAVFTEVNGSTAAASIIEQETGVPAYSLDTAMSSDYFTAMEHNIDTLKEALQ